MIKRTIHISSPCKLSLEQAQLKVSKRDAMSEHTRTMPIEDLGLIIIEEPRVSLSHGLIAALLANNVALVSCNDKHMPTGMMLNFQGHSTQTETFIAQTEMSKPLKKQLWQQVVKQKILNQAVILDEQGVGIEPMKRWSKDVRSGDVDNRESAAAVYYWPRLFERYPGFQRGREAGYPNNLLNYGYAILRAVIARAAVGSGLHPTLGLFHRNRYNAYCLADDLMEPYRPIVDRLVVSMVRDLEEVPDDLERRHKIELLKIPTLDVSIGGKQRPLLLACSETSASMARCALGQSTTLNLPIPTSHV